MVNTHSNYRYLRKRLFWEFEVGLFVPIVTRIQFWVEFIVIFRYVRDYRNIRTCFMGKNVIFPGIFMIEFERKWVLWSRVVAPLFLAAWCLSLYLTLRNTAWFGVFAIVSGISGVIGFLASDGCCRSDESLPNVLTLFRMRFRFFWFSNSLWCSRSCRW